MTILLTIAISCLALELFLRLPIAHSCEAMMRNGTRAGSILLSTRISEHWKEKAMPVYAGRMARETAALALCFGVLLAALSGSLLTLDLVNPQAALFIVSLDGIALGLATSLLYYVLRRGLVGA